MNYFQRESLGLEEKSKALLIMDNHSSHTNEITLIELSSYHIIAVFLPANCTSHLQPLDLLVNHDFKQLMRDSLTTHFATIVENQEPKALGPRIGTPVLRELTSKWLIENIAILKQRRSLLMKSFELVPIPLVLKRATTCFCTDYRGGSLQN